MYFTLKSRLLIFCVVSILLILTLMVALSSYVIRDTSLSNTKREVRELSNTFAVDKGQWILDRKNAVQSLAKTLEQHLDESPVPYLVLIHEAMQFGLTSMGDEQGNMIRQDPSIVTPGFDPRVRPWYKGVKSTNAMFVTKPYVSAAMKKMVVTIATPIRKNNVFYGVATVNVAIDELTEAVRKLHLPGNGYGILFDHDGTIISHPDASFNGKQMREINDSFTSSEMNLMANSDDLYEKNINNSEQLIYVVNLPNTEWALAFIMDKDIIMSEASGLAWKMIVTGIIFLVIFAFASYMVFKFQFQELESVSTALQNIAEGEGDLTVSIKVKNEQDEIGKLASGFNRFVARLHGMISRTRDIAERLQEQAKTTTTSAENNSQNISVQQNEVTMVATAVTEMASATEEIANNAEQTANTAKEAVLLTDEGKQQVLKSHSSINGLATEVEHAGVIIKELNNQSQAINSILLTISNIAEQTNLLALNAAIEAARAGEQGRGFAVVADEVRVLSQKTHASTQEIQNMIETLQQTASKAVDSMNSSYGLAETSVSDVTVASTSLEHISEAITRISDMASQIATAAEEQTSVTGEINRNTESIREVSEHLSDEAVDATGKAQQLAVLAQSLHQEVSRFKL